MTDEPLAVFSVRQEMKTLFAGTITIAKFEPQLSMYNISTGLI